MKRPAKYGNTRVTVDNITFASKREAARYGELKLLERAGLIQGLQIQPKFPIAIYGQKICTYIADFSYLPKDGDLIIEDVKGVVTDVFALKRKLVRACYGKEITLVR